MPNWCMNLVQIDGPEKTIDDLVAKLSTPYTLPREDGSENVHEGHFLFWNIVRPDDELIPAYCGINVDEVADADWPQLPAPLDQISTTLKASKTFWYDWNLANWGTKWELRDSTYLTRKSPTSVQYEFDTAWSPPEPVIRSLSAIYPECTVRLEYDEQGMDIGGWIEWRAGEETGSFDGNSRFLWCETCDESVMLDWGAERICPIFADAEPGSPAARMHVVSNCDVSAEALDAAASPSQHSEDLVWTEEAILAAIAAHSKAAFTTRVKIALASDVPAAVEAALGSFTADEVDQLASSKDPRVVELASRAIVARTQG